MQSKLRRLISEVAWNRVSNGVETGCYLFLWLSRKNISLKKPGKNVLFISLGINMNLINYAIHNIWSHRPQISNNETDPQTFTHFHIIYLPLCCQVNKICYVGTLIIALRLYTKKIKRSGSIVFFSDYVLGASFNLSLSDVCERKE